jgi:hypothetical protein
MKQIFAALLAASAGLCLTRSAQAQSLTIDDFTTGPVSIQFNGEKQQTDLSKNTVQKGKGILSGKRQTQLVLDLGGNPWLQNAGVQIKPANANTPAAMVFGEQYQVDAVPAVLYGYYEDPGKQLHNLDLTQYDRIRATFLSVNGYLDYVFQAFNTDFTHNDEWACDVPESTTLLVVDMPLANGRGDLDFTNVAALTAEVESSGQGGQDFAIAKLELVPASAPPGDVTCPPIGTARHMPPLVGRTR